MTAVTTTTSTSAAPAAETADGNILSVRGVSKSFGGLKVLHDVHLDVARGSIAGLIGPNGSGKSTLFDIITRYQSCDAGEITFAGESVRALPPHQVSRYGLVRTFQLTRIFPNLTVAENLLVFADGHHGRRSHGAHTDAAAPDAASATGPSGSQRVSRHERRRRMAAGEAKARELLEFVGLLRLADAEATGLSYGQLKLLEIAQVLMLDPAMLMLDEPMAGINPGLADEIVARLRDLRDRGMTLLIVEHNVPVMLSLCDSLSVLHGGRVMRTGAPDAVLADPEVREAFLGD